MLIVFTSLGATLVDAGFGMALIQRRHITPDDEMTVFVFALLSGILVGGIIWWAAPFISKLYHQPRLIELSPGRLGPAPGRTLCSA